MSGDFETETHRRREAAIYELVKGLGDIGKTKIQKMVYLLETVYGVDLGCNFILHQYGPYAESIDSDIHSLEIMGYVSIEPDPGGYGFHVRPLGGDDDLESAAGEFRESLDDLVGKMGDMEAWELEAASTICFLHEQGLSKSAVVEKLIRIKPRFNDEYIGRLYDDLSRMSFIR